MAVEIVVKMDGSGIQSDDTGQLPFRTIQVLRQHVLAFLGPPTYVSINSTVNRQKLPFSDPTHLFADLILEWSLFQSGLNSANLTSQVLKISNITCYVKFAILRPH